MDLNDQLHVVLEYLSEDYEFINLVDSLRNELTCYRVSGIFMPWQKDCCKTMAPSQFDKILKNLIAPDDFEAFLKSVNREMLMPLIENGEKVCVPTRLVSNGVTHHYVIEFAPNRNNPVFVVLAFRNVDEVVRGRDELEKKLENKVAEQTKLVRLSMQKLSDMQDGVIAALATLVESRDTNTGNHVQNTRKYMSILVERLRKDDVFPELRNNEYARNIVRTSVLHDIGKIFVSDMILNKPGKLTPDEFELVRSHVTFGKEIVDEIFKNIDVSMTSIIRDIAYSHHEKWNGKGYPQGLSGEEIPLAARIMAVADVFDALVSRRSYKEPYSVEEAMRIIKNDAWQHFDGRIVEAFLAERPAIEEYLAGVEDESGLTTLSGAYSSVAEAIQNKSVASAFVADYLAAGICNTETGEFRPVYINDERFTGITGKLFNIETIRENAASLLPENDEKEVFRALSTEGMKEIFADRNEYTYNYLFPVKGAYKHRQLRMIRIGSGDNNQRFDVLIGVRDIEEELALSETSEKCMNALIKEDINTAINTILQTVCEFYGGDRTYIYTFEDNPNAAHLRKEYVTDPSLAKQGLVPDIPLNYLEDKIRYMETYGVFSARDTDTQLLESEINAFHGRRAKSMFIAPVWVHDRIEGFWGVDNPSKRTEELSLLEDIVFLVSEAIAKENARNIIKKENELIRALVTEYGAIYRVNLVNRAIDIYGLDEIAKKRYEPIFKNPNFNLDSFIDTYYITPDVVLEDQDRLRKAIAVENCKKVLKNKNDFSVVFRVRRDGINSVYTEVKVFKAEEKDGELTSVILAFKVVDDAIRHEIERIQALHMASHDGLTGLLNRVAYQDKVEEYFAAIGSAGSAMAFLDLDLFKMVNDTYGHAEGDKILIAVAQEMASVFRDGELLCRIGGDEYSIFFPKERTSQALAGLKLLRKNLNARFEKEYPDFRVTISSGLAKCYDKGLDFNNMRILSDRQMYIAKLEGGNRIKVREVGLNDTVSLDVREQIVPEM